VALQDRGVGFGASAMQQEMIRAASARVAVPFGAVSIETPVRRRQGETFPADALAEVVDFARRHDLRLHLDGARIFIVAAFAGQDVKSFAAPFDTVYVSLYKYFGCPFGAILAGPAALLDGLHHERRRHGGGLYQMWPLALVAGHFLDEQERKWQGAAARGREVLRRLDNGSGLAVETLAHGSNIFRLRLNGGDRRRLDDFRETGKAFGLTLPEVVGDALPIRVNATWLRASADDIAGRLQRAAATLSPASP
jgi:threonine aldolase